MPSTIKKPSFNPFHYIQFSLLFLSLSISALDTLSQGKSIVLSESVKSL